MGGLSLIKLAQLLEGQHDSSSRRKRVRQTPSYDWIIPTLWTQHELPGVVPSGELTY